MKKSLVNNKIIKADIAINIAIFALVFISWIYMMFFSESSMLDVKGIESLKFYTVESNLAIGLSSLFSVIFLSRYLVNGKSFPKVLFFIKYASTGAVFVTFVVATAFLTPLYGLRVLFSGANLTFHLIIPIIAILDFILLEKMYPIKVYHAALSSIPTVVYGLAYFVNLLVNGLGWNNDFYGFALYGYGVGTLIFLAIIGLNFALNCFLRSLNQRIIK